MQNERYIKKNDRRRERGAEIRQDTVMIQYIRVKHNAIYAEAVDFYDSLNRKYPHKKDLRKTYEFKDFIANVKEKPIEQVSDPPSPKALRLRFGERHILKGNNVMELRIPLMSTKPVTTEIQEDTVTTEIQEDTVTPEIQEDTVTPEIQEDTVTTEIQEDTVTTEIIQEGTVNTVNTEQPWLVDEIIEDTIHPSLLDELDPDLIQQIIDELNAEPDLNNIMTDIEQEIQFEELGMDIDLDIPEDIIAW